MPDRDDSTVRRHDLSSRVTHWLVALSGVALLFSGLGQLPMYRRFNVVKIPGLGWSDDYEITLVIHYLAAVVFAAAVAFHIVYHWRRREYSLLPRRGDLVGSYRTIVAMLRGSPEPPADKFLPEQRVAYAVIGGLSLLLIGTGVIKSFKNLGPVTIDPLLLQIITLIHTLGGMLFMLLLVAHVGAFILKANRPLLPSMITGRVSASYARHRHPLWRTEDLEVEEVEVEGAGDEKEDDERIGAGQGVVEEADGMAGSRPCASDAS